MFAVLFGKCGIEQTFRYQFEFMHIGSSFLLVSDQGPSNISAALRVAVPDYNGTLY